MDCRLTNCLLNICRWKISKRWMFHCYVRLFFEGIQENHTLRQAKYQSASSLPNRRTRPSPAHHFHPCQTLKTLAWLIPTKQQTTFLRTCPQRHKSWKDLLKDSNKYREQLGHVLGSIPQILQLTARLSDQYDSVPICPGLRHGVAQHGQRHCHE